MEPLQIGVLALCSMITNHRNLFKSGSRTRIIATGLAVPGIKSEPALNIILTLVVFWIVSMLVSAEGLH